MKEYNFCNNCGKHGHLFHQCKNPITSIGIIVFNIDDFNNIEFLMIRRKDTLGHIDFMRGKYNVNNKHYILNMLKNVFQPMTLFKDKYNVKPPKGEGFYAHYDGIYIWKDENGVNRNGWYEYSEEFFNDK